MKKRKNIAIPMILAATIAAVSVPRSSQIVMLRLCWRREPVRRRWRGN